MSTDTSKNGAFDLGSLETCEERFEYKGKKYVVREADEGSKLQHTNHYIRAVSVKSDGTPAYPNVQHADIEATFVSLCVSEVGDDGREKQIDVKTVKSWPGRMVGRLYKWIKKASEMDAVSADTAESLREELSDLIKRAESVLADLDRHVPQEVAAKN